MSEQFLGELRMFPFEFAPKGWALCEGQILPITQNQALFSLLGVTYGGNGTTNFALPDLRGKAPVHFGNSINLGETGGEEAHALTINELPSHTHEAVANSEVGQLREAQGHSWAKLGTVSGYSVSVDSDVMMKTSAISTSGDSQPHNNMQPYLVMNYCIAIQGIFPSRN